MERRTELASATVAILGLGLMGGSLAMALDGRVRRLLAYDPDLATLELARRERIVEQAAAAPWEILPEADLVILAAPVRAIITLVHQLPEWHPGEAVVIDLGSTKTQVCQALAGLPGRFDPLGGHPMCGKSAHGLANAEASLFRGASFVFTPLPRSGERARTLAAQLAEAIGAHPLWLDAEAHDRWVAATSHAPYLLACALTLATPSEAAPLVGPGFRSASRLASSSTTMMGDILRTNRENVLLACRRIRAELSRIESLLSEGEYPALLQILEEAAAYRPVLLEAPDQEHGP